MHTHQVLGGQCRSGQSALGVVTQLGLDCCPLIYMQVRGQASTRPEVCETMNGVALACIVAASACLSIDGTDRVAHDFHHYTVTGLSHTRPGGRAD